ncbi:hypothetical protein [Xenorhabdus hominickii]|uniref:Uncharacterized protein n=1 Tax=Xenorhabdus hominickii TaxID=351679 RepID=A0A2G0PT65_XENHO|nr:hypothetical protein [Xenorhabdus hominickii]AOM40229.1 hypothetical protein A9255_06335 [Xenorhabdus hominickii]PHM50168.1 hypothetical protein Xhom_04999 [Xenorhabdus hominickii]
MSRPTRFYSMFNLVNLPVEYKGELELRVLEKEKRALRNVPLWVLESIQGHSMVRWENEHKLALELK